MYRTKIKRLYRKQWDEVSCADGSRKAPDLAETKYFSQSRHRYKADLQRMVTIGELEHLKKMDKDHFQAYRFLPEGRRQKKTSSPGSSPNTLEESPPFIPFQEVFQNLGGIAAAADATLEIQECYQSSPEYSTDNTQSSSGTPNSVSPTTGNPVFLYFTDWPSIFHFSSPEVEIQTDGENCELHMDTNNYQSNTNVNLYTALSEQQLNISDIEHNNGEDSNSNYVVNDPSDYLNIEPEQCAASECSNNNINDGNIETEHFLEETLKEIDSFSPELNANIANDEDRLDSLEEMVNKDRLFDLVGFVNSDAVNPDSC